ncbi:thiamine pyrophosphate TPP-binding domain-containing protein [Phocaeicola salanitronis DSM 18170]|uniref:Thiamine pyrophosphate TPP-binding domain-containing protein n=1 Tax=Phocaeicola salanitronis (strain DSM 18170 / JCM 13657 / CCUG 60908 / BL78) TaxID=667015 RepID=F0R6X1_PHOSB|nr:thiamine pyrophosphate-binding protein [Phocaeicola salanitronis]ADY34888.1 thiamine pyrophosphate TPP-binding domain-containing protein [Phocaeicola salanitronis DSM 18170]
MEQYYTNERNVQILIALLKEHGIKRVIASPGSTNVTFVGSLQQDPYFEMYSCVDERSAAYMACGMAAESGEPVVLSCTGATASRNYFPALTEAFYRKLPVLAVTSTQDESKIGHLVAQVIDRTCQPKDTVVCSVHLQTVRDENDSWDCNVKANEAILALKHHGGGPVHINLTTTYSKDFSVKDLPKQRVIRRYSIEDELPAFPKGKIAVFCGSHIRWTKKETDAIDRFCHAYNAVVFTDPSANYEGKYKVAYNLVAQQRIDDANRQVDLLIHIGNMSDFPNIINPKEVWRVSEDGKIVDRYKKLTNVFEMREASFFNLYADKMAIDSDNDDSYLNNCLAAQHRLGTEIPDLPFSHLWIANRLHDKLPKDSVLHLGILSPLRSWGYFDIEKSIDTFCNEGGFGIDGNLSTLIGASLMNPNKLYFGVVGDLSFFYDMNSLGNRHVGNNVRILLVNNSLGAEFLLFKQTNIINCVNDIESYISAKDHFGHQSPALVRHYTEDLGFEYLSASAKEEFEQVYSRFITPELTDKPMIFEVFTKVEDENEALKQMWNIEKSAKQKIKQSIKSVLSDDVIDLGKKFFGKN